VKDQVEQSRCLPSTLPRERALTDRGENPRGGVKEIHARYKKAPLREKRKKKAAKITPETGKKKTVPPRKGKKERISFFPSGR